MNKLQAMRDRIVEIAEENGWKVDVESNDGDNFLMNFLNIVRQVKISILRQRWKIIMYTHY